MLKKKSNCKFKHREKPQTTRQLKVSQEIHSLLVECLYRSGRLDPVLAQYPLNITKVNISPDLKLANCFYLPLMQDAPITEISEALEKSKYAIRDYITKKLQLRYSPEIRFFFDHFYEDVQIIDSLKQNIT